MKYHMSSTSIVRGSFLDGKISIFWVQNGPGGLGRVERGVGAAFPLLIITTLSKRLLSRRPEWDAGGLAPVMQTFAGSLGVFDHGPVFVRLAVGTMCQGVER